MAQSQGQDDVLHYCTNNLNQYTATDDAAGCAATAAEQFKYYPDGHPEQNDGNLLENGAFKYTWDAENRLVSVAPASSPVESSKRLFFEYDYEGRRVRKRVEIWQPGTGNWELETDHHFVYDGWNVVLVLDGDGEPVRRYTWGLDLSGQSGRVAAAGIHGAGGIGGLLSVEELDGDNPKRYWFSYGANGNVGQIIYDRAGYGYRLVARYEYAPYGNELVAAEVDSSGYVNANPFRFSTKWYDAETGLYYYGHRYYSPRLGRWLSRDPIEEAGG